jgi:hypothetical protein
MSHRTPPNTTSAMLQRTWAPGRATSIGDRGARPNRALAIYRELRFNGFEATLERSLR